MGRAGGLDRGLYQHPKESGIWWIRWHDAHGKVHREKIGPKSKARVAYNSRKEKSRLGQKIEEACVGERLTVRDLVLRYREELVTKNVKSAKEYVRAGNQWAEVFGEIYIESLQPGEIEKWKATALKRLAKATVNRALAHLKTLYNLAIRDQLTERNPLAKGRVRMMRENNARDRFVSPEEEAICAVNIVRPVWLAVVFALQTGLRQSEQMKLERSDVNLRKKLVKLRDSKGGKAEYIHLNEIAVAALREAMDHDAPYIWRNRYGRRLSGDCARDAVQQIEAKHNLPPGLNWHALRHTFISRLVMIGVPLTIVQKLARHKSIQMTLRYAHLAPGQESDAVELLAQKFPSPDATATKTATAKNTPSANIDAETD